MFGLLRTFCLLLLSVVLGSCIAIPIPVHDDDPFPNAREKLLEDRTTREYIFALLGEPASYEQGSEWVYTAPEIEWAIVVATGGYGGGGGGGTMLIGQQHFLILQFNDQDVVADYRFESAAPEPRSCTSSLYCHDGANAVMRFADKSTESQVKDFKIAEGQCGVYLFGATKPKRTVLLDGEKMGTYWFGGSFFFWNIEPGEHQIAVHDGNQASTSELLVTCQENELIFIENVRSFWENRSQLNIIESTRGRKWIAKKSRRLIVSESGRFEELPWP